MSRSDDALGDLHSTSRGADLKDNCWNHRTAGWRQLLCAWCIVLTVAALFKISDFISANRTAPFAHAIDLMTADVEQTGDIEHWERGVPRQQWTMTVPNAGKIMMVTRLDQ